MSVSTILSKLFLLVPKATLVRTAAKAFAKYVLPSITPEIREMLVEFVKAIVEADASIVTAAVAAADTESK
jgi:hypothetical protein